MFLSRRMEIDAYFPTGTLCMKVHRNGELMLTENTIYPIRIPGYELLKKAELPVGLTAEERIERSAILTFLRNSYRNFRFAANDLARISEDVAREMMERISASIAGTRLLDSIDREEKKKWSLEKNRDKNLHDSMQRSKKNLIDYAFNNQWTHFATFTVNSELCDRRSLAACNKKIGTMLNQFRRYFCEGFRYMIVPEKHEDGAFHYHGLVTFPEGQEFTPVRVKGRTLNTIDYFTEFLGYNSFSLIKNQIKAAKYITKYIDKQLKAGHIRNIREQIPDAKLLLHSRGLRKAIKLFFRKDALPEAIHRTVDVETGEVCFSFRTWGACRTDQDLSKLCKTIATAYDTDGYEIFGYVLGSIELLRKIEYFDIKI